MSTTITAKISEQEGFTKDCTAVFNATGILLIIEGNELGAKIPDEFAVEIEDSLFGVAKEGEEHYIIPDDRDAFIAMVFG